MATRALLILMVCVMAGCSMRSASIADQAERRFVRELGGVCGCTTAEQACGYLDRLPMEFEGRPIRVVIACNDRCVAYCVPPRSVIVACGLVERCTDEQIAAAIAHELGHLVVEDRAHTHRALNEPDSNLALEMAADAAGCRILAEAGIPTQSMAELLEVLLAEPDVPAGLASDLRQRLHALR